VIPSYRGGFYKKIISNKNYDVKIFAQKDLPTPIKTIHKKFKKNSEILKYFSIGNEKIVFTSLPFLKLLNNFDIFIVEGNPRYVTHFLFATFLRLLKKKVILWTMAHSHNNNKFREVIRLWWTKFFKFLFVYTDSEKYFLKKKGFINHTIFSMNNGIDQDEIDKIKKQINKKKIDNFKKRYGYKTIFLSCARLITKNKFHLAIEAFARIKDKNDNFIWIIIGDGKEKEELKKLVKKNKLEKNVEFKGAIYNEKKLSLYFIAADCLIHPASIGLSIIHSFGYGLPVITHSNKAFHNPEISAFKNNSTGLSFKMNNVKSLMRCIQKFLKNKNLKFNFTKNCYDIVRNKYNSNMMAHNFFKLINKL
jgi:glycosyltransferase involved in cell wall biosynthesis